MTEAALIFRQPFAEQVAAFRTRLGNLVPTSAWDDVWQAEHDRAFMVAGAVKADLLSDLGAAVDRAIAEGTGLEAFRKDFRKIVNNRGWHGWTGEGTEAGEAWRTRVIYRTNMATSYSAGRFAQLEAGGFKYWVYRHGASVEPRKHHLAWDRVALPSEHDFWGAHFPPNGWGCSCYVVGARTRSGIARVGGDPDKDLPDGWELFDPRTGAPRGVGKGWGYAPGASVAHTVEVMAEKAVDWPAQIAFDFMDALPAGQADAFGVAFRSLPSLADDVARYASAVDAGKDVAALRSLGPVASDALTSAERLQYALTPDAVRDLIAAGQTPDRLAQLGPLLNRIGALDAVEGGLQGAVDDIVLRFVADLDRRLLAIVGIVKG